MLRRVSTLGWVIDLWIAVALRDERSAVNALIDMGRLAGLSGRHEEADRFFDRAAVRARALGDPVLIGRSNLVLAASSILRDDFTTAEPLLEAAVEMLRNGEDPKFLIDALIKLGAVKVKLGQPQDAQEALDEALAQAKAIGDTDASISALYNLGLVAHIAHQNTVAEQYWMAAFQLCSRARYRTWRAKLAFHLGVVMQDLGQTRRSREFLEQSRDAYLDLRQPEMARRPTEYLANL